MATISDVLARASILAQQDWVQNTPWGQHGGGCLVGLLYLGLGAEPGQSIQLLSDEQRHLLQDTGWLMLQVLGLRPAHAFAGLSTAELPGRADIWAALIEWNDDPTRRHQDVLDALGAARAIAEDREEAPCHEPEMAFA